MNRLQTIVKRLCKVDGITMKVLASKMGITAPSLSKTLTNDNPRKDTIRRFAEVFGMGTEDFELLYHNPDAYEITHKHPVSATEDGGLKIVPREQNHPIAVEGSSYQIGKDNPTIDKLPFDDSTVSTHAEFIYEGTTFIADTFLDAALLINNLSALEQRRTSEGKDAIYQSMLSVLVKQYGKNEKE